MEFSRKSVFGDPAILTACKPFSREMYAFVGQHVVGGLSTTSERSIFRQVCELRRKYLGARTLSGRGATPCFVRAIVGYRKCPQGLNRSQSQKSKLWRLCRQNLSNGCSTLTGTILNWDGSRFYRRNQVKKSARPTLCTRALNGHFLEFVAGNIHRTCRPTDDIEKSGPKRRIAANQTAAPIRLRQHVRIVGREGRRRIILNSILNTAHRFIASK